MGVIYLDSCIVIYAVEDDGKRGDRVRERLGEAGNTVVAISGLDIGEDQFVRAARLRAHLGLKTPDALHLAVA